MRKIFPILLLAAIAAAIWYFGPFSKSAEQAASKAPVANHSNDGKAHQMDSHSSSTNPSSSGHQVTPPNSSTRDSSESDLDIEDSPEGKPAAEVYKSAEEAIEAVKKAALSYDDVVLEQFTEPGEECTWCDKFYPAVREMMLSTDATADQRSYYAELLATSGKVDGVMALVDAIKTAPNQDTAESLLLFAMHLLAFLVP